MAGRDCWSKLEEKEGWGWVTLDDDHQLEGGSQASPIVQEGLEGEELGKNRKEHGPGDCGRLQAQASKEKGGKREGGTQQLEEL